MSDIFERDLFGKGEVEIIPNLFAQELDADLKIKNFQEDVRRKIKNLYGISEIPSEIEDYIKASSAEPAMEESAIFDSVVDIVLKGGYDYYIYDLVPLGHALYYLSMASIYDAWIEKISKLREEIHKYDKVIAKMKKEETSTEDQILDELMDIKLLEPQENMGLDGCSLAKLYQVCIEKSSDK
ncbi:MAG: ArsA-related P-loop ATPase [bacterium]